LIAQREGLNGVIRFRVLPSDHARFFQILCGRRSEAELVPLRLVRFGNGQEPVHNECRQNLARWVEENPQCTAVSGWLVSGLILDWHTVVAEPNGTLPFKCRACRSYVTSEQRASSGRSSGATRKSIAFCTSKPQQQYSGVNSV